MISPHVWDAWLPPVKQRAVEWLPQNVWMPPGTEHDGPFDFDVAPHTRGVCEEWDNPETREITLCWATRNMKTSTVISLMVFAAATAPCSMALGSCDEPSIDRVIAEQLYPMLERCEATKPLLPPAHHRGRGNVELRNCRIRKAYSGSPGSVAGYPAEVIGLNEYSKWQRNKSSEADTARGFLQRTKGFPFTSKAIKESTPGEKATCRVWADIHSPTCDRREYFVQCPQCGHHQVLHFGDKTTPFGIKWDKPKSGHTDPLKAEATAYYLCRHKGCKIQNEDRALMMRTGVWLSEGQSIDKRGRIAGKRKIASSHVGFGPLSSLYSLLISGWGQIVKEFLACGSDPEKLRDFTNSTLALVWDPVPTKVDPHELGQRLATSVSRGWCPHWAVLLTRGIDVQDHAQRFPWDTVAWGPGGRSQVIDYGECVSQAELFNLHNQQCLYRHLDMGPPLQVLLTLIDAGDGNVSDEVYRLVRKLASRCYASKGATHKLEKTFKPSDLHDSEGSPVKLILINSERSQGWIESQLRGYGNRAAPFNLPDEARYDTSYLNQLLDEVKVGNEWVKTGIQDHRDCVRYAWAAAMMCTDHGAAFDYMKPRVIKPQAMSPDDDDDDRVSRTTFATGNRQWPRG